MRGDIERAALVVAIVATAGCSAPGGGGNEPGPDERSESAQPSMSPDSQPAAGPSLVPPDTARAPSSDSIPLLSLREIAEGGVEVGRRVRVEGRCIGYSRVMALGPQPRSRSDWQIVSDSVAVWVVGPYPAGCSGTITGPAAETYALTVALDTLPGLGDAAPRPRFYLINPSQRQ